MLSKSKSWGTENVPDSEEFELNSGRDIEVQLYFICICDQTFIIIE